MKGNREKIVDALHRPLKDLRISVIDKCNFRCSYCMPAEIFGPDYAFLPPDELLSFDEIYRLTDAFAKLGVEKVRLTGGEPLLRKGLPILVERLKGIHGIKDIALTTNGVFLAKHAVKLKEAGLDRVNVSLDAIDDEIFRVANGRDGSVEPVLSGIEAAQQAGLAVKINMVVKKGMNESQILPMARFFKGKNIILRYIEFMDVGNTNGWNLDHVISKQEILDTISEEMPLRAIKENYFGEVASRFEYEDGEGEIGIISSVSDSFCSSCTRARLSADGKLFTCLFAGEGYDVRSLIRSGADNELLVDKLVSIWTNRHDNYSDTRKEHTSSQAGSKPKIEMSYIGG